MKHTRVVLQHQNELIYKGFTNINRNNQRLVKVAILISKEKA